MEPNEENLPVGPWLAWVLLILFVLSIVAFGIVTHLTISDPPRHWDFGALPDIPAESIYSTEEPSAQQDTTRQLPFPANTASDSQRGGKP